MPIKNKPKAFTFSTTSTNSPPERAQTYIPSLHRGRREGGREVRAKDPIHPSECRAHRRSYCSVKKKENSREIHSLKPQQMAALQKGTA